MQPCGTPKAMPRLVLALGFALPGLMVVGTAGAAELDDLCAEQVESLSDPEPFLIDDLAAREGGDCAPAELLPDVSCDLAPSTFWPAAVTACDTPLVKLRRAPGHRGPRFLAASGRRPLKGVAASDDGSFRACGDRSAPLPDPDVRVARDPALMLVTITPRPLMARLAFDRGHAAPLAAGHSRRLDRPPEA
jgi:hypothetical protein